MRHSKMSVLTTAGVLALGLTGCGAAAGGTGDTADVTASAPASASAPVELTMASLVEELYAAMGQAKTAHMTMTHSGPVAEAVGLAGSLTEADIDLTDPDSPAMAMQLDIGGVVYDVIKIAGETYLNTEEMAAGTYVSVTEAAQSDHPAADFFAGMGRTMSSSADSLNPAAKLKDMEGTVTSFETSGTESVDGVETDVYTMVVDPAKAPVPPADGEAIGEIAFVYNVDKEYLPRKVVSTMGAEGEEWVTTAVFSAWGEAPGVVGPTTDQIISIEDLPEGTFD